MHILYLFTNFHKFYKFRIFINLISLILKSQYVLFEGQFYEVHKLGFSNALNL